MNSLQQIRSSFVPYIPVRWDVVFSDTTLNIVNSTFSAEEVEFDGMEYKTVSAAIAPGVDIEFNVIRQVPTKMSITFYENDTRTIYNEIKTLNQNLDTGQGGPSTTLTVTINEYNRQLNNVRNGIYLVQISGKFQNQLQQKADPYKAPLELLILGVNKEL